MLLGVVRIGCVVSWCCVGVVAAVQQSDSKRLLYIADPPLIHKHTNTQIQVEIQFQIQTTRKGLPYITVSPLHSPKTNIKDRQWTNEPTKTIGVFLLAFKS